ncbi:hypothetical protein CHS0354_039694 [Potamilus streckersoni]|uniref:Apple domain-containing protein n=1 Tax=Potamilus streckersoni TaxID=2493646 RepID=A0AAE0VVH9_9BIVA|nr:hypothetical protein CHS0354_039694 [Potamilus streckersoni]
MPSISLGTKDKILINRSFLNLSLPLVSLCARRCIRQRRCLSINYVNGDDLCILNWASHVTAPGDFIGGPSDVVYYAITDWDEALAGTCRGHTCPEDKICVPNYLNSKYLCSTKSIDDVIMSEPVSDSCKIMLSCKDCIPNMAAKGRWFQPLGCFRSSPKHLPHLIANLRANIDWTNLTTTIIRCAEHVSETPYILFGIEFYGECYAGHVNESRSDSKEISLSSCNLLCSQGVGSWNVMFVYQWI